MTLKDKIIALVGVIVALGLVLWMLSLILIPLSHASTSLNELSQRWDTLEQYGYHYQGQSTIALDDYQIIVENIGWGKPPTILNSSRENITIYYDFISLKNFPQLNIRDKQ